MVDPVRAQDGTIEWRWHEMFQVDVPDGNKSQLEMTLWDPSQAYGTGKVRVSMCAGHSHALV